MTVWTLTLVPGATTVPGTGACAEPGYTGVGQALARAGQSDYYAWLEHVRAAAGCTRPIRLVGDLYTVTRTGPDTAQILAHRHTDALPDSAIYKACGNRRSTVCPSCAQTYQRDAYHLLRAGLVGGKGVPETVSTHPAVFATFTAPSFGTVHTRAVKKHPDRTAQLPAVLKASLRKGGSPKHHGARRAPHLRLSPEGS